MGNNKSKKIGEIGEDKAVLFLMRKGYKIIKRNYHSTFGEIDIIAVNKEYILFVEVKTRKNNSIVKPCEAVTISKQRKIIKTALVYLSEVNFNLQPRFDVIEIINVHNKSYIYHIQSAFITEDSYEIF